MKKTVFLLLFFGLFISTSVKAEPYVESYEFNEYEFRMIHAKVDDIWGYEIEKIGTSPFSISIYFDDTSISIENVTEIDGKHVFHGFAHIEGRDTFYDAFYLVISPDGEELVFEVMDMGEQETVKDIFEIDNQIMICIKQTIDTEREYLFNMMYYRTYDLNYTFIDQYESNEFVRSFENTDKLLLINTDYDDHIEQGLTLDFELIEDDGTLPIESDTVFLNQVTINFINKAVLNNEVISNGVTIDYPGFYEIVYNGFKYSFSVESVVSGIENNQIYNEPVTPLVSSGNIYLNNDLFVSGTEINTPGNYTLEVLGANGYTKTYDFTITSNMVGVLHNQTYNEPVQIEFEGQGYLNNTYIESPYTISADGEYILKINGENNYNETYYFNIENPDIQDYRNKYKDWMKRLNRYLSLEKRIIIVTPYIMPVSDKRS